MQRQALPCAAATPYSSALPAAPRASRSCSVRAPAVALALRSGSSPELGACPHSVAVEYSLRPSLLPSCPSAARLARSTRQVVAHTATEEAAAVAPTPAANPEGWWNRDSAANMRDVNGIQELVDALADAGDKLVVVEFFAPWCNACKALYPKVCKLMADRLDDVVFLKVNFEANRDMCKTMGIKVLPMFHFYRGAEGKVDQFSVTISKIQRFKDALDLYTAAFCSLEAPPGVAEFPEIHAHHAEEGLHADADQPTDLQKLGAWDRTNETSA